MNDLTNAILFIFIMLGVTWAYQAHADDWVEVHIGSKHSEDTYYDHETYEKKEFNETNLGLGYMHGLNEHIEVGFGGYKNSYNIDSFYTGFDLHTDTRDFVRLGVRAGIITGYDFTPIMVLPNVTFTNGNVRMMVGWIPGEINVITVSAGFKF